MSTSLSDRCLLVVDPFPAEDPGATTLSVRRVPVEALQAGMRNVLSDVARMFSQAEEVLGKCRIEEVEISLAISADGSIGLLGTELATGAKGAIKLKLKFDGS